MINLLKKLLREEDGPTAVEYGVMLALIVVACLGAVHSMADATADSFDTSAGELAGASANRTRSPTIHGLRTPAEWLAAIRDLIGEQPKILPQAPAPTC